MRYREYCPAVHTRSANLIPETDLKGKHGYASIYSFREEHAQAIIANGSSQGFKQYPVLARFLVIDLDDGGASLPAVLEKLKGQNVGYTLYESGGKGYHVFVNCEQKESVDLPYQHKILAKQVAPACDVSLYRHSSLIRLPGTIHEKTGKPKTLLEVFKGSEILTLPEVIETAPSLSELVVGNKEALFLYYSTISNALSKPMGAGFRRNALWRISVDGARAGIPYDRVLADCLTVNSEFEQPKSEEEVDAIVRRSYG